MARLIELEVATTGFSTMEMAEYKGWGEFDSQAYAAVRIVDRCGPDDRPCA